jgi:hypothetical protein
MIARIRKPARVIFSDLSSFAFIGRSSVGRGHARLEKNRRILTAKFFLCAVRHDIFVRTIHYWTGERTWVFSTS